MIEKLLDEMIFSDLNKCLYRLSRLPQSFQIINHILQNASSPVVDLALYLIEPSQASMILMFANTRLPKEISQEEFKEWLINHYGEIKKVIYKECQEFIENKTNWEIATPELKQKIEQAYESTDLSDIYRIGRSIKFLSSVKYYSRKQKSLKKNLLTHLPLKWEELDLHLKEIQTRDKNLDSFKGDVRDAVFCMQRFYTNRVGFEFWSKEIKGSINLSIEKKISRFKENLTDVKLQLLNEISAVQSAHPTVFSDEERRASKELIKEKDLEVIFQAYLAKARKYVVKGNDF